MTDKPESELLGNGPVERLENALVRMAFVLEQRENHIAEQQKQKEAKIAEVTAQIDALEDRITSFLQSNSEGNEKKG